LTDEIDPQAARSHIERWRALPALHRARLTISELFADTEQDALSLATIAERLLDTGIPPEALEKIYAEDVAPACHASAPIGVWPSFDIDWLNQTIARNQTKTRAFLPSLLVNWQRKRATRSTIEQWRIIRNHLAAPEQLRQNVEQLRNT
jgi:hypothetical protein